MLQTIWTAIEPTVIDSLKALIGACVAFALAYLYRRTAELRAAHEAALKVELQAREQPMTSEEKFAAAKQLAMERLASSAIGSRIEQVLPKVRERADTIPPPAPAELDDERPTSPRPPPPPFDDAA